MPGKRQPATFAVLATTNPSPGSLGGRGLKCPGHTTLTHLASLDLWVICLPELCWGCLRPKRATSYDSGRGGELRPQVTQARHRTRRTRPRPAPSSRRPHLMVRERWRQLALLWPSAADRLSQHVGDPSLQRPAPRRGRSQAGAATAGGGGDRLPRDRGAGRAVGGRGQRQGGGPAGHGRRHRQSLPGAGQAPSPSPTRPASLSPSLGSR